MTWDNKVVWREGLFLRSHHFQQADRYVEMLVRAALEGLEQHAWGIGHLEIDQGALAQGKLAIAAARGLFPDGTPFDLPATADPPKPLELTEATRDCVVHLALPSRRPNALEVDEAGVLNGEGRYRVAEYDARDVAGAPTDMATLEIGRPALRLLLATQDTREHDLISVARVVEVRADRQVLLDDRFIPSCLHSGAARPLAAFMGELVGMLAQRADALAGRVSGSGQRGAAEIADFLMLQVVNRALPLATHLNESKSIHPEALFRDLVQLAGELATFTSNARRLEALQPYRHEDLQATFRPVMQALRQSLSAVLEQTATPIPLQERRYGVRVGVIPDRGLIASSFFVLAVQADLASETLRQHFPRQSKIGPVERIRELVNVALPGIPLKPLPAAPRQIPYHAGKTYFELDRASPLWKEMAQSGGLAIHVSDDFPGLEMECWAIRM